MFQLKPLSSNAVPQALERAIHYRLLNDPWQAESICRDILSIDPDHQKALVTLILSITDQFSSPNRTSLKQAIEMVSKLEDAYQCNYYKGLIYERQATAALKRRSPHAGYIAYDHITRAMEWYEKAEKFRPENNEDTLLRWNACARMVTQFNLEPMPEEQGVQPFLDV